MSSKRDSSTDNFPFFLSFFFIVGRFLSFFKRFLFHFILLALPARCKGEIRKSKGKIRKPAQHKRKERRQARRIKENTLGIPRLDITYISRASKRIIPFILFFPAFLAFFYFFRPYFLLALCGWRFLAS